MQLHVYNYSTSLHFPRRNETQVCVSSLVLPHCTALCLESAERLPDGHQANLISHTLWHFSPSACAYMLAR